VWAKFLLEGVSTFYQHVLHLSDKNIMQNQESSALAAKTLVST
jgi:hypothetical protein